MTDIEARALELLKEVCDERAEHFAGHIRRIISTHEALCRAIEAHDAFRQEVSEAVQEAIDATGLSVASRSMIRNRLSRFIIQPKTDPLVEAVKDAANPDYDAASPEAYAEILRAALAKRGLEIRETKHD